MTRATSVDQHFEAQAARYAKSVVPCFAALHNTIAHRIAALAPASIADIACGDGTLLRSLPRPEGVLAVGVDRSAGLLKIAAGKAPGPTWIRADAHALPLRDGAFEVVICTLGVSLFIDPRRALRELRRILAPGGQLLLAGLRAMAFGSSTPSTPSTSPMAAILADASLDLALRHETLPTQGVVSTTRDLPALLAGEVGPWSRDPEVGRRLVEAARHAGRTAPVHFLFDLFCGGAAAPARGAR